MKTFGGSFPFFLNNPLSPLLKNALLLLILFLGLRPAFAQPGVPAYVPQSGLVGWWPFTGNATDQSGKGNNGTPFKAVLTTDRFGLPNGAYFFDGDSSLIEVRDTTSLQLQQLTMSVWVYLERAGASRQIIYKGRRSDAYGEGYYLHTGGQSGVKIGSNCQANVGWRAAFFNQQRLPVNQWVHLCTTFDGQFLRNYYNGAQVDANPIVGSIDRCERAGLRFGYGQDFYPGPKPFLGRLDDIGLWNRALSPAEVSALYGGGLLPAGTQSGPPPVEEAVYLYPNPARESVTVRFAGRAAGPFTAVVADVTGRVVARMPLAGGVAVVPVARLSGGLYIVWVQAAGGGTWGRKKLLVE